MAATTLTNFQAFFTETIGKTGYKAGIQPQQGQTNSRIRHKQRQAACFQRLVVQL